MYEMCLVHCPKAFTELKCLIKIIGFKAVKEFPISKVHIYLYYVCFSLQAYEKGIALFKWPNVYDIWNTYLTKFIDRYVSTY